MVYNLGFFKICRQYIEYLVSGLKCYSPRDPDTFHFTTDNRYSYGKHPFVTALRRLYYEFDDIPDLIRKRFEQDKNSYGNIDFKKFFIIEENGNYSKWLEFAMICSNKKSSKATWKEGGWSLQNALFFDNEYRMEWEEPVKWNNYKFPEYAICYKKYKRDWINDNKLEVLCESEDTWY